MAHACPVQNPFVYSDPLSAADEIPPARCEGSEDFNGFYGHGIVNALNAVADPV